MNSRDILCAVFILFFSQPVLADQIQLQSGKILKGKILSRTYSTLRLRHGEDVMKVKLRYVEALSLNLDDGTTRSYTRNQIDQIPESELPRSTGTGVQDQEPKSAEQVFENSADAIVVLLTYFPESAGQGSGFFVHSSGVIVTNFHVVGGAEKIVVKLRNGQQYDVKGVIAYDVSRDLCLLKIGPDKGDGFFPVLPPGDSDLLKPGEPVYVIGAPLGYEYSITDGLYSGKRDFNGRDSLQFSAPVSFGNSGGPLLDSRGRVVGVTTFFKEEGQNVNFAVPANDIKPLLGISVKWLMPAFFEKAGRPYLLYREAREAVLRGALDEAEAKLLEALGINQKFPEAHLLLASVYFDQGDFDKHIHHLKAVLLADPKNTAALNNLGVSYMNKGKLVDAEQQFRELLKIDGGNTDAINNLSLIKMNQGLYDEAAQMLKRGLQVQPDDASLHCNLGWAYAHQDKLIPAQEELKLALALNPDHELCRAYMDWVTQKTSDPGLTMADFVPPKEPLNTYPFTEEEYRALRAMDRKEVRFFNLTMQALARDNLDQAIKYNEQLIEELKWKPMERKSAQRLLGLTYAEQAVRLTKLSYPPDDSIRLLKKTLELIKYAETQNAVSQIVNLGYPKFAKLDSVWQDVIIDAHYNLGLLYLQKNDHTTARSYYRRLLKFDIPRARKKAEKLRELIQKN